MENIEKTNELMINGIEKFYSLKRTYEEEYQKLKNPIINSENLSIKEKRNELKKLRPKCIVCKRPVGTIFEVKFIVSKLTRNLKAKCGDNENPCNLNIDIDVGYFVSLFDIVEELEKNIDKYKEKIIKCKNDSMFGYIKTDEMVEVFDTTNKKLEDDIEVKQYYISKIIDIVDNYNVKEEIKKLTLNFFIYVKEIKELINEYNKTNDIEFIKNVLKIYTEELKPTIKDIVKLKYKYMSMEHNEKDNTWELIQKKYLLEDIEENDTDNIGVNSLNLGVINTTGKKTKKNTMVLSKGRKTRKLVLDEEKE